MSQSEKPNQDPVHLNPFLQGIIYLAVLVTMPFHESAKYFRKHVYNAKGGSAALFFGVIATLGAGIASGYCLGWGYEFSTSVWLLGGIATALLTFFYAWPALYLIIFRKSIEWSQALWDRVPGSSDSVRKSARNGWFSEVLAFFGYATSVIFAIYVFWQTLNQVHDYLEWGWFGYAPGLFIGAIAGIVVGAFACTAVHLFDQFLIAVATGFTLIYFSSSWTSEMITGYGLGQPYVKGAYAVQGVLWLAYFFPLLHIVIGSLLYRLKDVFDHWEKLLDSVYNEPKGGYRELAAQLYAITAAGFAGYFSVSLFGMLGASYILSVILAPVAGFLAYLVLGKLLNEFAAAPLGLVSALGAGFCTFQYWGASGLWFGMFGQVVSSVVVALLTAYLFFPLAYAAIRAVADPLLTSWLRQPLLSLYESLSKEIFHAYENTYSDKTAYQELFLHVVNVLVAVSIGVGSFLLAGLLGFGTVLTVLLVGSSVSLSYLLIVQLLLKVKNYLVGVLLGLAGGVFTGAFAYANQDYGLLVAIPVGLLAAAIVFGVAFPVAYVLVRAFANLVSVNSWLKPAVEGVYQFFWTRFLGIWNRFVETYKSVKAKFQPAIDSFLKTYRDTLASIKRSFNRDN